jgi:hypothetical protein
VKLAKLDDRIKVNRHISPFLLILKRGMKFKVGKDHLANNS